MSKMSNQNVRDAESRSLDNAEEVARLRREVRQLRFENALMLGSLEGLEQGLRDGGLLTLEHMQEILSRFKGKP